MILLIVLLLVVILVGLLYYVPVSVQLRYKRSAEDDSGQLDVRWLYGIVHIKRRLFAVDTGIGKNGPSLQVVHQKANTSSGEQAKHSFTFAHVKRFLRDLPEWQRLFTQLSPVLRRLLRRVHMQKLEWTTLVGTGDAVSCGMTCGAAWAATSTLVGVVSHILVFDRAPQLSVQPDFQRARFDTSIDCILRVRAGYAIGAGFRMIRLWRRRHLHGAPDSRTHAHGDDQHP